TGVELDLSAGNLGLHLVYGPNEAGKTSALRALEHMLFGIPVQTADNFLHPYNDLRVGATLGLGDGRRLTFLRRKGAKRTLLGPDNATDLDEAALVPFLGAMDRNLFSTMFGIGHEQLVRGGREIVAGSGEVGQVLFAAGAGIADLRKVQARLTALAEALYKPGGKNPRVNDALRKLDEAKKRLRQLQLPCDDWARHQEALETARCQLAELDEALRTRDAERNRLDRIRRALPLIARRKATLCRLGELGDVRLLPPDFAEQRREAVVQRTLAQENAERARSELKRIGEILESLHVPEDLLAESEAIEAIPGRLGAHRKAQDDLPGLVSRKALLEARFAEILAEIRPDLGPEAADRLRLTAAQQDRIQRLSRDYAGVAQRLAQARQHCQRFEADLAEVEIAARDVPPPRDAAALAEAVRRAQSQGDLERQLALAQSRHDQLAAQAAAALRRLPRWSGTLEALEQACVPVAETIDRFAAQLASAEKAIERLDDEMESLRRRRDETRRALEQLQLEGAVPSEDELRQARQRRDEGWRLIVQAWLGGTPDDARIGEYLGGPGGPGDLADAYARRVEAADGMADRLRREASRVAQHAALLAEQHALEQETARVAQRRQEATAQRDDLWTRWVQCWRPAGIEPLAPEEMRGWLVQQRDLVQRAADIKAQQAEADLLRRRIEAHRRELSERLAELGFSPGDASCPLESLVRRSQEILEELEKARRRREQIERDLERLQRQLETARRDARQAEADLSRWEEAWALALEPLGLAAQTLPESAATVLDRIAEMKACRKESGDLAARIEGIRSDAEAFRRDVRDLVRRVAPDLAGQPEEQAAEALVARLRQAQHDSRRRDELAEQQRRCRSDVDREEKAAARQTARLAALCQEAGCRRPEDLPNAERASDEALRLRAEMATIDQQLAGLSAGAAVDAFVTEAGAVDPDALAGQIDQLDEQVRLLADRRDELQRTIGREEQALRSMDPGPQAAECAEQVQDLLARLEADAAQFVRLKLALAVLREGIERYRKKNEGHVLRRAGELFRRLTRGSFDGLVEDPDEEGQIVLKGVRARTGQRVELAAMSDGTADQLYLALRVASLEHYLEGKEPMPFVIDDVLVGFDDDRAAAALDVLAELSRRTQVIFFTHHAHLVGLAQARLDPSVCFVHQLGA
ncbi:MAG: AAA family ATPase, partial [Thermoguttaceae bacterium]|nr:AAA family ATPase [Thermoguttaceae bacterium]